MFFHSTSFLIIFVAGIICMFVGFGLRDRNLGMVLLGIGFFVVLVVCVQRAFDVFT